MPTASQARCSAAVAELTAQAYLPSTFSANFCSKSRHLPAVVNQPLARTSWTYLTSLPEQSTRQKGTFTGGRGQSAKRKVAGASVQRVREKLVILRLNSSQALTNSVTLSACNNPSLSNTNSMETSSNSERRAMFRNWMNSCRCTLPLPSAMLLDSDKPAPRNCSA